VRLFIAIEIPNEIRNALMAFVNELRPTAPRGKWVRAENLHVTLKFLGETAPEKSSRIQNALSLIHDKEPVTLNFRGLGFFPNERRPRVFWVGMEASDNLKTLAEMIDGEMHKLGFPLENRPFTPHLTLTRFEPPGLPPQLGAAAKSHAAREFGSHTAREFHLIESKLKRTGAEYTTLQSVPFVAGT
jgi:2'-5' RNA ligase